MLEYCKKILTKVSFDPILFEKELIKSINWLNDQEKEDFKYWCNKTFKIPPDKLMRKS